jgi:hypothetical protein
MRRLSNDEKPLEPRAAEDRKIFGSRLPKTRMGR